MHFWKGTKRYPAQGEEIGYHFRPSQRLMAILKTIPGNGTWAHGIGRFPDRPYTPRT
jgi:hypothetical protein